MNCSGVAIVEVRLVVPEIGKRIVSAGDPVQAAGLVGTLRPLWTTGTNVAFLNQPDINAHRVNAHRERRLKKAVHKSAQQFVERLLLRDFQKQLERKFRIEVTKAVVSRGFHFAKNSGCVRCEQLTKAYNLADESSSETWDEKSSG